MLDHQIHVYFTPEQSFHSDVSYCDSDSVIDVGLWDGVCVISSVLSCHTKI